MTNDFDSHFAAVATDDHFARFADEVVYRPRGGDPVALTAILGPERREERERNGQRKWHRALTIRVTDRSADPTLGIPTPQATGTIEIAGEIWAIEAIGRDGNEYQLHLLRDATVGQSEYRKG